MIILIYNSLKNFKKVKSMKITDKGYKVTDWIFFFNKKNKEDINKILNDDNRDLNDQNKELKDEFVTWKLITVFLPLLTFALALILNLLTNTPQFETFFAFFNNGSLPIIAFGILTSGMPYLLELLENYPDYQSVRRRVMAIALFFLFLSASLYILQTLSIVSKQLGFVSNCFMLILSIYVFLFSSSVGYKMFLLKTENIIGFADEVKNKVNDLKLATADLDK